jgi:hypothetical protein
METESSRLTWARTYSLIDDGSFDSLCFGSIIYSESLELIVTVTDSHLIETDSIIGYRNVMFLIDPRNGNFKYDKNRSFVALPTMSRFYHVFSGGLSIGDHND